MTNEVRGTDKKIHMQTILSFFGTLFFVIALENGY